MLNPIKFLLHSPLAISIQTHRNHTKSHAETLKERHVYATLWEKASMHGKDKEIIIFQTEMLSYCVPIKSMPGRNHH